MVMERKVIMDVGQGLELGKLPSWAGVSIGCSGGDGGGLGRKERLGLFRGRERGGELGGVGEVGGGGDRGQARGAAVWLARVSHFRGGMERLGEMDGDIGLDGAGLLGREGDREAIFPVLKYLPELWNFRHRQRHRGRCGKNL